MFFLLASWHTNNPVRIQFIDGSVTKYVYSATGKKLCVLVRVVCR